MTTSQASLEDTTSNVKRLTNKAVEGNLSAEIILRSTVDGESNELFRVTLNRTLFDLLLGKLNNTLEGWIDATETQANVKT